MKNKYLDKAPNYKQELRSEKVRNIIGPIPSILVYYGITAFCFALFTVGCICAFLPFRKMASGIVYISSFNNFNESINHVMAELKFDKDYNISKLQGCKIICYNGKHEARGVILTDIPVRTELGGYMTQIEFDNKIDLKSFENTSLEFKITLSETTVLNQLLSTIKTKVY